MTAKKLFCIVLLTLAFAMVSHAQESTQTLASPEAENPKTTTLIDAFGRATDCDMSSRVDNLFIQLNSNPEAIAYVISYAGLDFLPDQVENSTMARRVRRAMSFRRYETARVVFVDGGYRESQATEMWLVPFGALPPKPSKTIPKPKLSKNQTFLWGKSELQTEENYQSMEEFVLPDVQAKIKEENRLDEIKTALENAANGETLETSSINEIETPEPEQEKLSPEEIKEQKFSWVNKKFAAQVAARKNARGVIIFYADDLYYDISQLQLFVEEARNVIATDAEIGPNSITVIFGGYRGDIGVEYWLVPKGGMKPEARPDERPVEGLDQTDSP